MINFQRSPVFFYSQSHGGTDYLITICPCDSPLQVFILLCIKGGEGDGPSVISSFQLRWAEACLGKEQTAGLLPVSAGRTASHCHSG